MHSSYRKATLQRARTFSQVDEKTLGIAVKSYVFREIPRVSEWRIQDSNLRPLACHASALPTELIPQGRGRPKISRTRKLCQVTTVFCFPLHIGQSTPRQSGTYQRRDLFILVFFIPNVTEPHWQSKSVRIQRWPRDVRRLLTHFKSQLSIAVIEFLDKYFGRFWHANVANHLVPLSQ